MIRRLAVLSVIALLVATTSCTTKAKPQNYTVKIDGKASGFNGVFTAYFPNDLTIHPGDTVRFQIPHFTGEPHTVTFGTLIDSAVKKIQALGPKGTPAQQENSPELLKVPDMFVHDYTHLHGPPMPNKSAAQPCYLDSGTPPLSLTGNAPACPQRSAPEFNGTQSFYNSGVLAADAASTSIKFSKDTKPGTYNFMCLIHRGGMTAHVTVVDSKTKVPSSSEDTTRGTSQLQAIEKALAPAVAQWKAATAANAGAGFGVPTVQNAELADFGPKELTVKSGGTLSWNAFLFHALALNAPEGAVGAMIRGPDGNWTFNPKAGAPSGGPPPPIEALNFPPPDNGHPITYDGGTFDGSSFHSTGIFGSVPPIFVTYKVTFTKPGTYEFRCLVHPDMKARITVT